MVELVRGATLLLVLAAACDRPPATSLPSDVGAPAAARENVDPADADAGAKGDVGSTSDGGDTGDAGARLAALTLPAPLVDLEVAGFAPAIVSVPLGARVARPVILATHGNYDRPEWQCQVWRGIVADRAFVLCPRGVSRPDSPSADDVRFTYANNQALEKEIDAGLAALRARFGAHVDPGAVLYTGFSLGAIMGVAIATRGDGPGRYPRMVLVEGGHDRWTAPGIKAFAKGGDRRVLFACGQASCAQAAKRPAALLEKAGVTTRIVHGRGVGHGYDGPVADEVKGALAWILEGDARF